MRMPGTPGQIGTRHLSFRADGAIASASAPQLVLPESWQRSFFELQNTSTAIMYVEYGSARATATLTGTGINPSGFTITNGGFGFTLPPHVEFMGGGNGQNTARIGTSDPFGPAPQHPAKAHAVLTAGVVTSIVLDDPGIGYLVPPYVRLTNNPLDFIGCADPSVGGASGLTLYPAQLISNKDLTVPTDQVAIVCATLSATYFCRYM